MSEIRLIEPGFVENAQVRIQQFYKTHTLSFSVSPEVKMDTSLTIRDGVLFYLGKEDLILQTISLPWSLLFEYEEVWVQSINAAYSHLYAPDDLIYSYRIQAPYR